MSAHPHSKYYHSNGQKLHKENMKTTSTVTKLKQDKGGKPQKRNTKSFSNDKNHVIAHKLIMKINKNNLPLQMKINKNKLPLVRSLRCELAMVPFSEPRVTDTAMATVRVPPPPKPTNAINNTRKNKKKSSITRLLLGIDLEHVMN